MAVYNIAVDNTNAVGGEAALITAQPSASVGLSIVDVWSMHDDSAFASRNELFRASGGTVSAANTPAKLNSRSPAAVGTFNVNWTVNPVITGGNIISFPFCTAGGIFATTRWMPPNPRYPVYEDAGSTLNIDLQTQSGGIEANRIMTVALDTPGACLHIGRMAGRRNRKPGIFQIGSASRGMHGNTTTPFNQPYGWDYAYVQRADWDLVPCNYSNANFLNLLNGASGAVALAGDIAGVASLTANLTLAEALAGGIAGQATLAADLKLAEALAGAIAGVGSLTANLRLAEALAGSIAGVGALSADLKLAVALATGIVGQATLTGALALAVALQGAVSGQAALTGDLSTGAGAALAGAIAGQASLTGALSLAEALAGAVAGQASLTGDLSEAIALSGQIAGVGALSGALSLKEALAGSIAGVASLSGTLTLTVALTGAIQGVADIRGSLTGGTGVTTIVYPIFIFDD